MTDGEITVLCPHCGRVNSHVESFIAPGADWEEIHQCRSCLRSFVTDEVEPEQIAFVLDCDTAIEFIKLLPEEPEN
jgi:hypothetical protein